MSQAPLTCIYSVQYTFGSKEVGLLCCDFSLEPSIEIFKTGNRFTENFVSPLRR